MKIQDLAFLGAFIFLIYKQNTRWSAILGIACLVLSIPLYASWTFFTAERLVFYSAAFFLLSIILYFIKGKN